MQNFNMRGILRRVTSIFPHVHPSYSQTNTRLGISLLWHNTTFQLWKFPRGKPELPTFCCQQLHLSELGSVGEA